MKAGFAVGDITPELGIYLTGYGLPERLAEGIHSPLRATAMVLSEGDTEVAVVSLDWCFIANELAKHIREAIASATGIPFDHTIVCCTHTHSAPHTSSGRSLGRTTVDPERRGEAYARESASVIAETVMQAKRSLREAVAGFGAAKSQTGVSRRGTDENGKVTRFIADPYQICDDNMTVIRFLDRETREDLGIVIHLGCHNTSMGHSRLISSDWCGVMRERVGSRYPAPVMFINGAFGDVGPRTNRYVRAEGVFGFAAGGGDGERAAAEVGLRAAADALQALEAVRDFRADLPLKVRTAPIRMPQSLPMGEAEARQKLRELEAAGDGGNDASVDYLVTKRILEHWQLPPVPERVFDQTVVAFGPAALAPFPNEVFSIFSLRLRKYGPFAYNLLCGNANGSGGYLPDRSAIAAGGYEVTWRSRSNAYVLDPEAGDLAITQTLASLRKLTES
jgi:hypothetical protein